MRKVCASSELDDEGGGEEEIKKIEWEWNKDKDVS